MGQDFYTKLNHLSELHHLGRIIDSEERWGDFIFGLLEAERKENKRRVAWIKQLEDFIEVARNFYPEIEEISSFPVFPAQQCKICYEVFDFSELVNISDIFYACKSCVKNKWNEILELIGIKKWE